MNDTNHREEGPVAVAALLLFVQGAVAVALAAEAGGAAIVFGGLPAFGAILTVAGATITLVLVARLRLRRRSTRRWILALQWGWMIPAAVDLGLALALAGRGLTPSGFLVRFVLPASIVWILRRPEARAEFHDGNDVTDSQRDKVFEEMSA